MELELAKEVIDVAAEFLSAAIPAPRGDIRLEQIEEKVASWSVVLSYPELDGSDIRKFLTPPRAYKELSVDINSKEVKAIRFWKPA